jgi:transposase
MKEIKVIGIDLAKSSFSICAMTKSGQVVMEKTLTRQKLIEFTARLQPSLIAFEACGGAHHWGRLFLEQGHQIKCMSSYDVKPFAPASKKNDQVDAKAIAKASLQSSVEPVAIKQLWQQDIDVLHNQRDLLLKQKIMLINQCHGVALEYGVALPKAAGSSKLQSVIEDAENKLTSIARAVIKENLEKVQELESEIEVIDRKIHALIKDSESFKLLKSIPGVGLLTAAAVIAHTSGKVDQFKNGRHFAAYLGLVPRQFSTGGKTRLGGITKSGPPRVRQLLVIGTRSVITRSEKKEDVVSQWIKLKHQAKGYKITNVALANKTARIIYAVLKNQTSYEERVAS